MGNFKYDLTGQRFGNLTVIKFADVQNTGNPRWTVKCDCGRIKDVEGRNLRAGNIRSCGCLRKRLRKRDADNRMVAEQKKVKQMIETKVKPIPDKQEAEIVSLDDYIGQSLKRFGNTCVGERLVKKYGKTSIIKSVKKQFGFDVTIERTANNTLVLKVKKEKYYDQND